ncbi:hypothetical protein BABINDRAFT_163790 [Babjeviella inositovora NRRL Y-12698]|uniref:Uncharacterized protein n=1 Tax=Babjeviella inositovora NRRL Y-12698 TaxID=984486 RepID=A0A1E3QJ95_9ASCO|nr:uncharacterized protein BABINDRAFT_163790 [Babjeviella inositovora NRRL Y-12698]ODQ77057.1 hypothetical protein BABINDRAFT_163790 [Babjeviella inositovora NRRL Y-12698]
MWITDCLFRSWGYLVSFFYRHHLNITVIGLQNAGKTTFAKMLDITSRNQESGSELHRTRRDSASRKRELLTIPTVGYETHFLMINNVSIKCVDLGGQERFYRFWNNFLIQENTDLIVYIIDLSDGSTIADARAKLHNVIRQTNDSKVPILILGNKLDIISKSTLGTDSDVTNGANNDATNHVSPRESLLDMRNFKKMVYFTNYLGIEHIKGGIYLRGDDYGAISESDGPVTSTDPVSNNGTMLYGLIPFTLGRIWPLKQGLLGLEDYRNGLIELTRDVGIFIGSLNEQRYISDIIRWILGNGSDFSASPRLCPERSTSAVSSIRRES